MTGHKHISYHIDFSYGDTVEEAPYEKALDIELLFKEPPEDVKLKDDVYGSCPATTYTCRGSAWPNGTAPEIRACISGFRALPEGHIIVLTIDTKDGSPDDQLPQVVLQNFPKAINEPKRISGDVLTFNKSKIGRFEAIVERKEDRAASGCTYSGRYDSEAFTQAKNIFKLPKPSDV